MNDINQKYLGDVFKNSKTFKVEDWNRQIRFNLTFAIFEHHLKIQFQPRLSILGYLIVAHVFYLFLRKFLACACLLDIVRLLDPVWLLGSPKYLQSYMYITYCFDLTHYAHWGKN